MELSTDIIILLKSPSISEAITPIRVSAIPPAILQLAPGSDVRAEVLGKMLNGRTLLRIAGEVLTMELPESVPPGSALRMTFLGRDPRPTFSLSLQQNSDTPVAISQTGRWLGQIVQGDPDEPAQSAQLGRLVRLTDGPPVDTSRLAASLREALSNSGLFYESHLAEWAAGERDLASIMKEPQASLNRSADGTSATLPTAGDRMPGSASAPTGTSPANAAASPQTQGSAAASQPAGTEPPAPSAPATPAASAQAAAPAPAASATSATSGPAESTGTAPPGKAGAAGTIPITDRQPVQAESTPDHGTETERPAASTAPGAAPRTAQLPAETESEALRPGTQSSQTPASPHAVRGETAPVTDAGRQPALPTDAPQTGTIPSRPTPPPTTAPPVAGQPPTSQPQPPPSAALPGSPPPPAAPPLHDQRTKTPTAQPETGEAVAASRQLPESSPQLAGRLQSQQLDEPAAEEAGGIPGQQPPKTSPDAAGQHTQRAEVADPRAAPVIREQLAALNSGVVVWNGEAWPGQPLRWQVEDREARHRDSSEGRWHSELRVDLPNLGRIVTELKVRGKDLHISLTADTDSTTTLLQQETLNLEDRLAAAGLKLANMVIRHGKEE